MAKRRANGEGSIFKRKDGLWAAQYTDNIGKKRTLYGKTQQIVKDKLKEAIRQSDNGIQMDKAKITFVDWFAEWLEVYIKPTVKMSTYQNYYITFRDHIEPRFKGVLLKDLRGDILQKFFNEKAVGGRIDQRIDLKTGNKKTVEGGLHVGTLHKIRRLMVSAINQAIENGIVTKNVARNVKLPPYRAKQKKVLTVEEQKRFEKVLLNSDIPVAFALYLDLYTGLRVGEILALKNSDIDLENKELHVRRALNRVSIPGTGKTKLVIDTPKTEKSIRAVPLVDKLIEPLREFMLSQAEQREALREIWEREAPPDKRTFINEDYLFFASYGKPHESSTLDRVLRNLEKCADVEGLSLHSLRHTFATRCLEAGFDVKSLADILGHSNTKTTLNIYAHALPDLKRTNMNKLAELMGDE